MSSILAPWYLQNFDLEKKEENSETDEDGLKAESPELVWQMLCAPANQTALSTDDRARCGVHVKRKHFLRYKKKINSVSLCLIVSASFINVSLSMADVVFSQIFSCRRRRALSRWSN